MRLVTFSNSSGDRAGCLIETDMTGAAVIDLSLALGRRDDGFWPDIPYLLASESVGIDEIKQVVDDVRNDPEKAVSSGRFHKVADVSLQCPVGRKPFILCAGANYGDHLAEMSEFSPPTTPLWFVKSPNSVIGADEDIELPPDYPNMVDFEGELAIVIGRPCHRVDAADALNFVAGYTLVNDVSARDWVGEALSATEPGAVRLSWGLNIAGKQFPTFCPIGPVILTSDQVTDWRELELTTRVNGVLMQKAKAGEMLFSIPELIEYLSRFFSLVPGDIISTGSPAGVGLSRNPQVFLTPGDTVTVSVEKIGDLRNTVV